MIKGSIKDLIKGNDLSADNAYECMEEMMSGSASDVAMASFLTALSIKGASVEEITAFAKCMRNHALEFNYEGDLLEIVGTGGDASNSFNISTTAAIVTAAADVRIAKHGNRAASSKSGAADCLEALGVNITLSPEKSKEVLDKAGICFLFAQNYHSAMKHVANVRKELGIRTVFNILGPLANPAKANMQLLGVYEEALVLPMASVLQSLGVKKGMVVYSYDRLDELSVSSDTLVCEFDSKEKRTYKVKPEDFGLERYEKDELRGGEALENANITRNILSGKEVGAKRSAVVINAGAALYVAGKVNSVKEGVELAQELIDSGKAFEKLKEFIKYTNI